MWHVASDEVGGRFHQAGNEGDVARQAIQFRDDQSRVGAFGVRDRRGELWPVCMPLTRFDLGVFIGELGVAGLPNVPVDRCPLRVETESAFALQAVEIR